MIYLLGLIIPFSFFYSPQVNKNNVLMVAKPLSISKERNTPAYSLFEQAQKVNDPINSNVVYPELYQEHHQTEPLDIKPQLMDQVEQKIIDPSLLSTQFKSQNSFLPEMKSALTLPQNVDGFVIRGQLELSGGVGIVDHTVILYREFEGQKNEVGLVYLEQGQYQIAVNSLEGELVAEVADRNGFVIGEGRKKIAQLRFKDQYYVGPTIEVSQPLGFALNIIENGEYRAHKQNLQGSFFSGFYSLKKTTEIYPNVARHSSTLAVVNDIKNIIYPMMTIRNAGDRTQTQLFLSDWVQGAKIYLQEQLQIQFYPDAGTLIGKIHFNGLNPQELQLRVVNKPSLDIYFLDQFMIPDKNLSFPSSNGYFMIPGLESGNYEVAVYRNNNYLGSQLYFVDQGLVSYQEIKLQKGASSILVRSFDAFLQDTVQTEIEIPGLDEILNIDSDLVRYRHSVMHGLAEIINRPLDREYMNYIYVQNKRKDHLHLPQIKEGFLENLVQLSQIQIKPDSSVIIGFTPQDKANVHLIEEKFDRKNIVYFDSQGQFLSQYSNTSQGGGFVIFNVPEGIQEVVLESLKDEKNYSMVFYSRPSVVFVTHFN